MELGAFSVSLTVKDIGESRSFYEKLGFEALGPVEDDAKWVILRNGPVVIGLFEGMFDENILTFNPGWNQNAQPLESFTDVRDIQRTLEEAGIEMAVRADPESTGVAHIVFNDPDGNVIMLDQHVPKP